MNRSAYNILILSAGRRVELVECFQSARDSMGIQGKIVTADASLTAPASYFADACYQIARIGEDDYIPQLIQVCKKEDIALVIPTIDTELLTLVSFREQMERETGAKVLLSSERTIQICRDKTSTQKFFEEHGFGVPREYQEGEEPNHYPVFIKPKNGSSSVNAFRVNCREELDFFRNYVPEPIVQEYMEGVEYSIDVFCDFAGKPITIVPRIRLAVRGGEILQGKIVKDRELIEDVRRLIEELVPIGQITVQCMKTEEGIRYIEINPRFGGGTPMSIKSGANSCKHLYRLLQGEVLEYREDYREELTFLRFDASIALDEQMVVVE